MDLRLKALELENKAKKSKGEKNYEKAVEFYLNAAEIYKQIGDVRNWKWNLANYHSLKGMSYSHSEQFHEARKNLKKAEELFLELKLREPAFTCASEYIRTFIFELKSSRSKSLLEGCLENAELFIEKHRDFSEHRYYIDIQISFYKTKSMKFRMDGKYEMAETWAGECCKLAKQAYDKFKDEGFRKASIYNEHFYWNLKAKRLETEKKFEEAAESYKKSAEVMSKIDEKVSSNEYINYHKCIVIANKYNEDILKENINNAVEFAEKIGDEKQKYYLLGLKYDHLGRFAQNIEEKIDLLEQAKENYYRAEEKSLGKDVEFPLFYYLSKKELRDGNYESSIGFLNKAMECAKHTRFPNIVSSPSVLEHDKHLHESYLYLSKGEFFNAASSLENWLSLRKELKNTNRYKFYEILKYCCVSLSKDRFTEEVLFVMEENLQYVREKKLGVELYRICSLVYSFVSLWVHNIRDKEVLEKVKLEIVGRVTTSEVAKDLEYALKTQKAIEERDWLLRLPPIFAEKFDYCLYLLENILDEFKHSAYREFYTLLENFLKIIIVFNAKLLWSGAWKSDLERNVTNSQKTFERFTFGDLVQSLDLLKGYQVKFVKDTPKDLFDMLNKHVEIRNNLSHEFIDKLPEIDIVQECSRIMFRLLQSFPTCINVIETRKKPWYDVEVVWSQLPRRITIYFDGKTLEKGYYYAEPMLEVMENKLYPKVMSQSSLNFSRIEKED